MFPLFAGLTLSVIMAVTVITGRIYDKSKTMLSKDYKRYINISVREQTPEERKISSILAHRLLCSPSLKVWIGGLYFMKISTALTMLSVIVNLVVYVLLSV